jgi:hypothetical protein
MFVVTESDAAAIRAAFDRGGELFGCGRAAPAVPSDHRHAQIRACARTIAGWTR